MLKAEPLELLTSDPLAQYALSALLRQNVIAIIAEHPTGIPVRIVIQRSLHSPPISMTPEDMMKFVTEAVEKGRACRFMEVHIGAGAGHIVCDYNVVISIADSGNTITLATQLIGAA